MCIVVSIRCDRCKCIVHGEDGVFKAHTLRKRLEVEGGWLVNFGWGPADYCGSCKEEVLKLQRKS